MNVLHKIYIVLFYVKISVTLHMVMKLCPPIPFPQPLWVGDILFFVRIPSALASASTSAFHFRALSSEQVDGF